MSYAVKEMFYSLQGEGRHTGRPAVFCRFAGCNLWSGRERDRAKAACNFCDTDFVGVNGIGGGRFNDATSLAIAIENMWGGGASERFVVLTGGEPLLKVGDEILSELHDLGFEIALETNGTLAAPNTIDWITVSPKGATTLVQTAGNELKLVFPQAGLDPAGFEKLAFDHFLLQPLDGPQLEANTAAAIAYCLQHPRWRLSLQTHKFMGIR
ncbi:MAG: 7-carboxy-7-deazaguanine synthase [Mesorhizobium sp.]|uniref:7-carboxy-7-deazaguanine synthase n=1 Tax=Mesorhizobium sp. TaxID=1871066 RepID=UPI00121F5DC3|nr:7-carboxy-7-deazaguanine synthase [Mesorhizobium sp.]TIT00740.1 MAG: 7-carboxy-7-deazaguanine synthase [Mesorhizobium sp.]TKD45938.1 MAG: 7-carboxy-7-deazaguanine synthase [Mesorhizobium sp.]